MIIFRHFRPSDNREWDRVLFFVSTFPLFLFSLIAQYYANRLLPASTSLPDRFAFASSVPCPPPKDFLSSSLFGFICSLACNEINLLFVNIIEHGTIEVVNGDEWGNGSSLRSVEMKRKTGIADLERRVIPG